MIYTFFGWTFSSLWALWVCVRVFFSFFAIVCHENSDCAHRSWNVCIGGTYSGFSEPNSHRRTHRNAKHIVQLLFFVAEQKKRERKYLHIHPRAYAIHSIHSMHTVPDEKHWTRNISWWYPAFFLWVTICGPFSISSVAKKKLFRALNKIQIKTKQTLRPKTVRERGKKSKTKTKTGDSERARESLC